MKNLFLILSLTGLLTGVRAQGFKKIFNGKNLSGWTNNGTEKWYVERGELVCESGPEKKYGYLSTQKNYKNFILELDFKLEANGNSGVFIRSGIEGLKINGWQVEVAPANKHTGGIYESYGRGWLIKPRSEDESALKPTDWNKMRIEVIADEVTSYLNGQKMVKFKDEKIGKGTGFIALQIHDGGGIKVRWKNIRVKELPDNAKPTPQYKGKIQSLFDGKTFAGWHNYNKAGAVKSWAIEDGALVCLGEKDGGDLVSDTPYENFEFSWEWKLTAGSNSGVMYHVVENPKYKASYHTGPEYQMIDDDGYPVKLEDWQKTACDYAMSIADDKKKMKPISEWQTSKIVFNHGLVEHWLNGEKVLAFNAWSESWLKLKTTGKWKDFPDYGSAKKGHIVLQDHGNKVFFRNIRIQELK